MTTIEFTAKNGEALIPVHQIVMIRRDGPAIVAHLCTKEIHKTSFASEDEAKRAYETVRTAISEAAP